MGGTETFPRKTGNLVLFITRVFQHIPAKNPKAILLRPGHSEFSCQRGSRLKGKTVEGNMAGSTGQEGIYIFPQKFPVLEREPAYEIRRKRGTEQFPQQPEPFGNKTRVPGAAYRPP
jgi:hypothetical protein